MDVMWILEQLRGERDQLDDAIAAIERMASSGRRGRGRPPAWLAAARQGAGEQPAKRRGRPPDKNSPTK